MTGTRAPATGIVSLSKHRVHADGSRSLWLQQALARSGRSGEDQHGRQLFSGHASTDVCIIGGGNGGFALVWAATNPAQVDGWDRTPSLVRAAAGTGPSN